MAPLVDGGVRASKLGVTNIARLSNLLDQALDLPVDQRSTWLASLSAEFEALVPTLRELLARDARHETGELIDRAPLAEVTAALGEDATVGPYRLLRELGSGGMGAVWLAERHDGSLKRRVALKLPHEGWVPGLAERFARERQILASLEHANIARLYDAGLDESRRPYMALEYVEGQPIDAYCLQRALGVPARLRLLLQVADAVAFAHSRLVVHRDLKPGNILVTDTGQVRLLDFGIAKLLEGDRVDETALTRASGRALTLDYASPEQIRGAPIGTASDVYSLGVVAFELLAGQRPYRLARGAMLETAIAELDIPLVSSIATEPSLKKQLKGNLDAILNKALKKDPAERYATVDALAQDWRAHLDGQRVLARPDTWAYRFTRWGARHRAVLAIVSVAALAMILAIGFGATAVVVAALSCGLGAALWQARRAARARDRALVLSDRNEAVAAFLNLVLTDAARGGAAFTAEQLLKRSEDLIGRELSDGIETQAVVLSMIGTSLQTLGNPAEAIRLHERAIELVRHSGDQDLQDTLAGNRALSIGWGGRAAEARAILQALLARGSTSLERRTEIHHYLAQLASANNEAEGALHHAGEALRSLRKQRRVSPKFEASILSGLGAACSINGRMAEADQHFAAAAARFEGLGLSSSPHFVTLLNNWGVINDRAGDIRQSLLLTQRALRVAGDGARSPFVVCNLARAFAHTGQLDEAQDRFNESLQLAQRSGATPAHHASLIGLAGVALQRARCDDAHQLLRRAWSEGIAQLSPTHPNKVLYDLATGQLALGLGRFGEAIAAFDSAIGAAPPVASTVMGWLGRGETHLAQAAHESAWIDAQSAWALSQRLQGGKPHSWRSGLAALLMARVLNARTDRAEVRRHATTALEHLEAMVIDSHPALVAARQLAQSAPEAGTRTRPCR